jgi:serine phosphatase RsbU (regulator of sigma subunit)/anti-sigma regulatory factor (Ser/Thr protein kinase)
MDDVSISESVKDRSTSAAADPATVESSSAGSTSDSKAQRRWLRRRKSDDTDAAQPTVSATEPVPAVDIAPSDPLLTFLQTSPGVVDLTHLTLASPAVTSLREAGVVLVVPLVASGELVGMLQLGPRLSERDYSKDDRELLEALARHAAPALRLGQMVREQEIEARSRERIEQELQVAQLIQQQFLPKDLPDLPTWSISAFYRPARTVGGDFYDFFTLPDGRVMVVTGDVTDKGVPAALVMASTHAFLKESGPRLVAPSEVLAKVNDLLCEDIPAHMFVTCQVLVLDPPTGQLVFANAGHNLPYVRGADGTVRELRATGMPLGLMPGMSYEQAEAVIEPGEHLLLYSDGLTEQHDANGDMFGFGRTQQVIAAARPGDELTDVCVTALSTFTGRDIEQEDDITLVALRRTEGAAHQSQLRDDEQMNDDEIIRFEVPSQTGNEREALQKVADALADRWLTDDQMERLKTAVAEATMNAIEHGNKNDERVPVDIVVQDDGHRVLVTVTDLGGEGGPVGPTHPDLELKLAGLQTPRGWGLFLIENMVDDVEQVTEGTRHSVRLVVRRSDAVDDETTTPEADDA